MTSGDWVWATPEGAALRVKVIPRAGRDAVAGIRDGRLLIRLAAPPVDNAANEALVAFIARSLRIPARNISIESGARSRAKQLALHGVRPAQVEEVFTSR